MSGFLSRLSLEAAIVVTDAATWAGDCVTLAAVGSKAHVLNAPARGVMTGRGFTPSLAVVRARIQMLSSSFDEILAALPEVMRRAEQDLSAGAFGDAVLAYEIVMAGWSEGLDRPVAFTLSPHDRPFARAYVAFGQIIPLWSAPAVSWTAMSAEGFADPPAVRDLPTREDRLKFMEAMRRSTVVANDLHGNQVIRNGGGIAGFLEETTITREGVTKEIVRVWQDRPHERIDPSLPAWSAQITLFGPGGSTGGYGTSQTPGGAGTDTSFTFGAETMVAGAGGRTLGDNTASQTVESAPTKGLASGGDTNTNGSDGGVGSFSPVHGGDGAAAPSGGGAQANDLGGGGFGSSRNGVAGNAPGGGAAGGSALGTSTGSVRYFAGAGGGSGAKVVRDFGSESPTLLLQGVPYTLVLGDSGAAGTGSGAIPYGGLGDTIPAFNGGKGGAGQATIS